MGSEPIFHHRLAGSRLVGAFRGSEIGQENVLTKHERMTCRLYDLEIMHSIM